MADLTITTTDVKLKGQSARDRTVQVGEAVSPGDAVRLNGTDSKYYLADADAGADEAAASGVVLVGAPLDGYAKIVESGPMDVGATLTVGVPYIASANAGKIAPAADFQGYSGAHLTHLGYATAADTLDVDPKVTGASN